jgi:hypothetical protein
MEEVKDMIETSSGREDRGYGGQMFSGKEGSHLAFRRVRFGAFAVDFVGKGRS